MLVRVRATQKLVDRRAEARPEAGLLVLVDARRLARRRPRLGVHRISHVHLPQVEIVVETNEDFEATVAVAADGGNILFDSFDETNKKVKVILQGACNGCPSSTFTLKSGIENMLKDMLNDKDIVVEAVNG